MSIVPYTGGSFIPSVVTSHSNAEKVLEARGESAKSVSGDLAEGLVEVLIEKSISASDGSPKPILHRIAEVRAEQGVSLRSVSRRTGIEVRKLKQQEDPHYNLSLAELLVWQRALDVPLSDLLIDSTSKLSQPVQQRAQLVKIMKTVAAIAEVATTPRVSRMVMMLREQLLELMPELKEVSAWPNYGQRRAPNQVGKIGESPIITSQLGLDNNGD
jgi:transcriptional regulator with XRE-family HTH domain